MTTWPARSGAGLMSKSGHCWVEGYWELLIAASRWCDRVTVVACEAEWVPPTGGRVVMLSDGEQRRLADIESALRADDPRFVHRLESRRPRRRTVLAVIALVVAMTVTVVAL